MNCTVCGNPFVIGTDAHSSCRRIEEDRRSRERRVDALLELFSDEIDSLLAERDSDT